MTFADAAKAAARVAAALLGWSPDVFWAATPADLRTALGLDVTADAPADAGLLIRLMEAFPDDE
ncbi:MAG: phage tail assembly chaperone [Sandarakinorhabdus sp.]|nr:phage tail assembly chaperone [Sandarakinorhabdus sp.]